MGVESLSAIAGGLCAAGLALLLYLAAPAQRLRRRALDARAIALGAVPIAVAAIVLLHRALGLAEAIYAALLVVMIVLTALPFVAAAWRRGEP